MAITVRNLITNAARQAGIIGVVENLNSNEASQALNELNNIMEHLQLENYYPHNNVEHSVSNVTDSFTMGRTLLKENGFITDSYSGTITGLAANIVSSADPGSVTFTTPTITVGSDVYYCDNTLTLYTGTVSNSDSSRTDSAGSGTSFSGPTITAGETLTITNSNFTVTGNFYKIGDIYADRPNRIVSLLQVIDSVERPLQFIPESSFDQAYKTNSSVSHPTYYTVRGTFPFLTIQIYPNATNGTFKVFSQIITSSYGLNDEINLPQGYQPLIQYKLARQLAEDYGYAGKAQQLLAREKDMIASVKKLNNQGRLMTNSGSPIRNGRYNINTDSWI